MSKGKANAAPLRIMVASSVHGFEENLEQVYATLTGFGYEVWCSYKGTIPNDPGRSNLEDCVQAARDCDLFLGILRPIYGTGIIGDKSITHEEMLAAVQSQKPRWFLAHRDIDLLRQVLKKIYIEAADGSKMRDFKLDKGPIFDDLRVVDMYNDVLLNHLPVQSRTGYWVQPFFNFSQEGLDYIRFQFQDTNRIRAIVNQMKKV